MKQVTSQTPAAVAHTDCNLTPLHFPELIQRRTTANFDAGFVTSDGGGLLLGRMDRRLGHIERFSRAFTDHRKPELIEHSMIELLRQRVYGIALGYEDLNDHESLKDDPAFSTMCGKNDPLGKNRIRAKDRGKALAGKSTLNRLELTPADASAASRYKKIVGEERAIEDYFINEYVRSLSKKTRRVVLDLDATDDPLHGEQEGRFFHGYYKSYCYLPLYIFAGHWPVIAKLQKSDKDAASGALEAAEKIVRAIRRKLPRVKIVLRADSGFCRDPLMSWCEKHEVGYIFGIGRNAILERQLAPIMEKAELEAKESANGKARIFYEFGYKAKKWPGRMRRVVGKAEHTSLGSNPRFIITNLEGSTQYLYEKEYCARGEMENRIKEQQLDLFADRTSTATFRANQLRLWFSTLAYLLIHRIREIGLSGTELARASCGTIRLKLFKLGALVRVSARRVQISLSSSYPYKSIFRRVAEALPG